MIDLDLKGYKKIIAGSEVVSKDGYGDKVLRLADGTMAKLFRRKHLLSSVWLWPYAERFENGAKILRERNVPCAEVIQSYRIKEICRDVVVYRAIEGKTLRDLLRGSKSTSHLLTEFAEFFATLHGKGIYFRAIHFGNVIVLPEGGFGLIDLSELRLRRPPLSLSKRIRNFKPILRQREDREAVRRFGFEAFLDLYGGHSNLKPSARERILRECGKTLLQAS